jgi:hypothetical protein
MRTLTRAGNIPNPLAGAGFAYQFSPNRRTKIESLIVTLTTSATVGNRFPLFELLSVDNVPVFFTAPNGSVPASTTAQYILSPQFGAQVAMNGTAGSATGLAWPNLWMPPGWQLVYPSGSLQAGDQLSNINFAVHYAEDAWDQDEDAATYAGLLAALG